MLHLTSAIDLAPPLPTAGAALAAKAEVGEEAGMQEQINWYSDDESYDYDSELEEEKATKATKSNSNKSNAGLVGAVAGGLAGAGVSAAFADDYT